MTATDLCVNKPQMCDLERVKPQTPPSLLLGLEPVQSCLGVARVISNYGYKKKSVPVIFESPCTELFISPSGISELDCATTKTDTAERSIAIGRESLQVFFVLGALAYFQVPPLGGSRDEKWRSQ